ncbi:MAG: polysaccharide deacetylase family protein [Clostridia bacterium]|nr:polysaccharide deacetylase family protein [Clostridia bacterium]
MAKYRYHFLRFPGGKPKAVTLSYDDGMSQDIKLVELMKKYGFKGTFNLNSGAIPPEGFTPKADKYPPRLHASVYKKLYTSDVAEVACHGYAHVPLHLVPPVMISREIIDDRKGLEEIFGGIIRGFAYPCGNYTDEAIEILKNAGISYARTVHSTERFDIPKDWYRLPATCHHKNPRLMELAEQFDAPVKRDPRLFYLWGHSYEFDDDDNWDVIETFFKRLGGKEDIWYATNIEVYDYVTAFERLEFSADNMRVYNPSAMDVWIGLNEELIFIPAGKTVNL